MWHGRMCFYKARMALAYSAVSQMHIYTDASGLWDCGACFSTQWLQWQCPSEWFAISIMAKELVPIVLSCAVWGPQLTGHIVLFRCDNSGVVISLNKGTANESNVMHLMVLHSIL